MLPNPHRCRCGGRRRDRRVRAAVPEGPWDLPRYPWVAAGPGRGAGRRRQDQGGPRDEANRPQHNRPHWCGGRRRDRRARPRCWSAAAAPGGPRGEANRTQHNRLHWCGGRRRDRRARPRCWSAAAGPGRASRSTTPSEARVWRSRGRAAADQHTQRPGPSRQATRRSKISRGLRRPDHPWGHKHQK